MESGQTFKIKPLTKAQITISLDRLTRFKPTEDKYLRVFKDIVVSNLIYPKQKKSQLDLMDYAILTEIVQTIFNYSLECLGFELSNDFTTNKKLQEYEKLIFKSDKNIEKLLKNKIDYKTAINIFDNGILPPCYNGNLPLNLKWLKSLAQNENQIKNRLEFELRFPIEKVIIVEGLTEEILLPKFAKICEHDFDKIGAMIISAGGKNQVVKLFYKLVDILKLPIFVLLDNDAKENFEEIIPKLRNIDNVHMLEKGEFEDVLPLNLIKRTLNQYFKNYSSVILNDLKQDLPMTQILDKIFKQKGFDFKKAEFASLIKQNILTSKDVSLEIEEIIKLL